MNDKRPYDLTYDPQIHKKHTKREDKKESHPTENGKNRKVSITNKNTP